MSSIFFGAFYFAEAGSPGSKFIVFSNAIY